MFGRSFRIFTLFGFAVRIDPTWLLLAILVTWTLAVGLFPFYFEGLDTSTYWWMGVAGTLGLLFSIVFHELSHSIVARRYGLPIRGITLFIFGGVAEMEDEPPNAKAEFLMAVAGPISSFILAIGFYGAYKVALANEWHAAITGVVFYLAFLNALLGTFNLVPAFPLDGGRMLRAALWGWKDNYRSATRTASRIGSGFGVVLIVLGVLQFLQGNLIGGVWWVLIGLFLRAAAAMSYRQVLMRQALQGEPVRRFMKESPVTVPPHLSVHDLVEDYIYKYHFKMFPVTQEGRVLGWVSTREAKQIPREEWPRRTVMDILQPASRDNTISPEADAVDALSLLNRTGSSRLLVVERDRLVGVLTLKDLMKFLALKFDLEEARI